MPLELKEIMSAIKGIGSDGLEKTAGASPAAAAKPAEKTADARATLLHALDDVLAPPVEKTAAAKPEQASATGELVKMATSLAGAEDEALKKEAHLYGAAVADGFISRLGQYQSAAGNAPAESPTLKTASADGVPTQTEFEKFAAENPELTKQAIDLGYLHGKTQIEQLKQAAFEKGYNDTQRQIVELQKTAGGAAQLQKAAADISAQNDINVQLEKLAETPEGREKLAEIKLGYDDTMNELTKMANDTFDRGYRDVIEVMKAM